MSDSSRATATSTANATAAEASAVPARAGRYAAIDIGTVTCRMLVADVDAAGKIAELTCEYAITNLGEGVDATGRLKPDAIARVVSTVKGFLAVRDSFITYDCPHIDTIAIATSASRDAENADEFVDALRQIGVELTVIPGEREAALSFAGASCDFAGEELMVVDIGGGSTEVVVGPAQGSPRWAHSFNIGCRRVTERFLAGDPPTESELTEARAWIREEMRELFSQAKAEAENAASESALSGECTKHGAGKASLEKRLRPTGSALASPAPFRLTAVAGTATTIVTVRDGITEYDSKLVHKQQVTRDQLDAQFASLSDMPLAARQQVPGLDPGRAPVIVAGLLIMQTVMDLAGMREFTVSETDILQGIVLAAATGE